MNNFVTISPFTIVSAPLQIDEDEMKMDQDPAPMAFATPDDMTLIKDFPNDMDHNYENYKPGDDDMETASMPLPNDITGGVAAMPRELPEVCLRF